MKAGIELLSPAGDMEKLEMAVKYGADAVYLAGKSYGMRAAAGNFDGEELETAVSYCHRRGVKAYLACNTLPRNDEIAVLPGFLESAKQAGVDALIVADAGVFALAKRYCPDTELHISTQAGIVNYETANFWYDLGAVRVILARELSLEDISLIRDKTPKELELEAFVHGSMCVSFSGRCLLSNYLAGRDANRGACAQPCRWKYSLVEERRPGQFLPVCEDENGTHIFNSKDLCMIEHIPLLAKAGVSSIKLEGRMKSAYYTAIVTGAYRAALDACAEGRELERIWLDEVEKISHREYYTGFYFGKRSGGQHYADSTYIRDWDVVAFITDCDEKGRAEVSQRNRFWADDELELVRPGEKPLSFKLEGMTDLEGAPLEVCPHPEMRLRLRLPVFAPPGSILRRRTDT